MHDAWGIQMGQVNWVRYLPSWAPSHIVGSFKRVHRSAASVFSASGWRPALITHNHSVHTAHTPLLIFKHVYQNQPLHWNRNLSITLAQHATARIFTGQSTGSTWVQDGSVSVGSQLEGTTLWPIHFSVLELLFAFDILGDFTSLLKLIVLNQTSI